MPVLAELAECFHAGVGLAPFDEAALQPAAARGPALARVDALAAQTLEFLRSPRGNRLEALKGDRKGQHSIRINDQFRVCFRWAPDGPEQVEIVDYH